ncbi:hypothetical protein QRD89_11115 [Halobacillus sp. ACCC02827]|uniref:hypothetical protein n=1 Tax=unclassified Halobacillus TaxID=2636472 RepID=UPI000784F2ED|nr:MULTISPECIES: hypothetical protein [unclassified Halobacillus]WJE14275.1 hypothetical protein QRD89_11115 [Halobacillus sp. ACCC02827]
MSKFVCITCGVQYPEQKEEPEYCPICLEERQYVHPDGQQWTTHKDMVGGGVFRNEIKQVEKGLYSITTAPSFGIGQTAYLVLGKEYNVLWDCITYLDEATIEQIDALGGVGAIALSHPHYYSRQLDWAEAFKAPIYIHADDADWVMEPGDAIQLWEGEVYSLQPGVTLHRLGGHFKGGAVLHWEHGLEGDGVLLSGDIIQVVQDTNWVSFMYSYPNLIPLPAEKVRHMVDRIEGKRFTRLYNAFHKTVRKDADAVVQRSADRYIQALEGELFST